jgi:type IV secretion system protein VirB2
MRFSIVLFLSLAVLAPEASASAGGGALPWESPLQTIADSISGPVAYAISLIGIVVAGAMLVWGGEINEFARRIIMLVLVISLIVFATQLLSTLFNVSGAVIA